MSKKHGIAAALLMVAVAVVSPVMMQGSDAADDTYYHSQLDGNGEAVYGALGSYVNTYSNTVDVTVQLPDPVLFGDTESAKAYAEGIVRDALAAKYYDSPMTVYLWDLPVKSVDITVKTGTVSVSGMSGSDGRYIVATSVSFTLSVPDDMRDDETTEVNELKERMGEMKTIARETVISGSTPSEKVKSIASALSGVGVIDDEEGTVSNIYDVFVNRESSSAGIAAAFTQLCVLNGVDAIGVKGGLYAGDETKPWYWNMVKDDGKWYAVDVTRINQGGSGYMMAGTTTPVDEGATAFSATRSTDLDLSTENGLQAPALGKDAYPYPDDTPFFEKYGMHILMGAIAVVIAAFMLYAIRSGNA